MALNVKIDFTNRYEITALTSDLHSSSFITILKDGTRVLLGVKISDEMHPLIPNVYNLAFGPTDRWNRIDDQAKLPHKDHSKVFSTILYFALEYLTANTSRFLGIDGSSNARAYLYYRCILYNYTYLAKFFEIYGIKYYIRLLRMKKRNADTHSLDYNDIRVVPELIRTDASMPHEKLYNYFIFRLRTTYADEKFFCY